MTNPAAYLRPRLGHALSHTAGSMLTLAHQALVRRGSEHAASGVLTAVETAALADQDDGLGMPVHRVEPAAFNPPEQVTALPVASRVASPVQDQMRLKSPSKTQTDPMQHSGISPSKQVLKLVKARPAPVSETPANHPQSLQKTAISSQIIPEMLAKAAKRQAGFVSPYEHPKLPPLQANFQSNGQTILALNAPFAAQNVQAGRAQAMGTPVDAARPPDSASDISQTAGQSGGLLGVENLSLRQPDPIPDTVKTESASLSDLVENLLRPQHQPRQAATQGQAAPEDDFDFQTRLRAALADILAQDMLRHGLRIPGVF